MPSSNQGKLFIMSAPSGAGKTTLINRILSRFEPLSYSVSHTTRQPRGKEEDGVDYFFITPEEFETKIQAGDLLEWAKVHGNFYGTSRAFVEGALAKGKSLLLDIDVQGALQIMATDLKAVSIFIMPPSFDELERRLIKRGTDTDQVIRQRLINAKDEMAQKDQYDYVLVNDDLDEAVRKLCRVFEKEIG